MRVQRRGSVDESRPTDWGKREKHPAYSAWCNLRRYHLRDIPDSWKKDFWAFVKDVPEKPASSQTFRPDSSQPWSKDNFYWKEKRFCSEDEKEYMREWHKKARLANPEYYFRQDLKKNYGVTLEWYRETLSKQNNACAICKQPEVAVIRNKTISLAVDHCHETGKARGLLCTKCNRGLGLFRDTPDILENAIQYLKSYSS